MTAKRQIESSLNSGTMLDGSGGHVKHDVTWVRASAPPLRAQLFRGPSEHADLIPWRSGSTQGSTMNSAMSGGDSRSIGNAMSMTAHPGPPH